MATQRVWWCLACGRRAAFARESLDPRYPLVLCQWQDRDGEPRGHGIVPGTADPELLARVMTEARRDRVTSRHPGAKGHHAPHPDCRLCHPELRQRELAGSRA